MDNCNFTETREGRIKKISAEQQVLSDAKRALLNVSTVSHHRNFPNYFVSTVGFLALEIHNIQEELMHLLNESVSAGEDAK